MPSFYINTYRPLVATKAGRDASEIHDLPPLIDGSIRREPDLEHAFPAISCLCRASKFAPRLKVGDVVTYFTAKGRYQKEFRHWRLTAVLEVHDVFATHSAAAEWYRKHNLTLPNNCMVPGNAANPLELSHRIYRGGAKANGAETHRSWDAEYRARAMKHKVFVVCQRLFRRLTWDAPVVTDNHLKDALGFLPGTQNPRALTMEDYRKLMSVLRIAVPLCVQ